VSHGDAVLTMHPTTGSRLRAFARRVGVSVKVSSRLEGRRAVSNQIAEPPPIVGNHARRAGWFMPRIA
jgi:hypothetical protein